MLNYIWLGLILAAVLIGGATGRMAEVTTGAFDAARMSVMNIALPLVGVMALWLGIMRLAEKSGVIYIIASGIRPVMRFLFPEVPPNHPANGAMLMNIAANMLGLGNAATPLGIKAMRHLEQLNPRPGTATNAMCTFLAINTSSVQLVSATTVGILAAAGSVMPTAIIGTALVATMCSTMVALIAVKTLEKLPLFQLPPADPGDLAARSEEDRETEEEEILLEPPAPLTPGKKAVLLLFCAAFVFFFAAQLNPGLAFWLEAPEEAADGLFVRVMGALAVLAIPFAVAFFPLYAALNKVKVYEEFVEGAKEGFNIALRIIPYLVAIFVAIGMFRGADGIALLAWILGPILEFLRFPVDLLPLAFMRPLSGSGSQALLAELAATHGPDSFLARAGATLAGSTETTFYVLAVYFGAVGIRRTRHAVPAGLLADVTGIIVAVTVATIVFG